MKTTSVELHPEDETLLVATREDGTTATVRVLPTGATDRSFIVTMPDTTTRTVWWEYGMKGDSSIEVWKCNGAPDSRDADKAIRWAQLWLKRYRAAQQAGRAVHEITDLHGIYMNQQARLDAVSADDRAAAFFKKYNGRRISR